MRNFVLFFLMGAFGIFAKAQNDFTVSWLSVDTSLTGYGSGSTSTITAFMEFDLTDLTNYKSVAITLDTVKQVQFYIEPDYRNSITACNVVIRQGSSIGAGTDMVVQSVPTTILVGKWNNIDLDTFYTIDPTKKLYIGYQLSFTASTSVPAYPFSTASNTNPKQGWIKSGDNYRNLINDVGYALGFLIKAVVTSAKPLLAEIVLTSLDIEQYNIIGDSLLIKGTIEYLGPTPLTSFNLVYTLDGVSSSVDTITGLNIATNTSYTFSHSKKYYIGSTFFDKVLQIRVSKPNDVSDIETNNTMNTKIRAYYSAVPRVILHEVFTSSTCPPCNPGNVRLKEVLEAVNNDTKWACIKYQYNFPSPGDPYCTAEGLRRGTFYGGINSVPTLFLDGTYSLNPGGYVVGLFNRFANIPAIATMTASATTTDKTVGLQQITINPVFDMNNSNLRFFAGIVEKKTFKNIATNGEHEFMYVMKKFMTSVDGDAIASLQNNVPISLTDYSYTFNGDYRLPANSSSPINHTIENSVEDFQALMVVYWIQDIVTKEVFQAGKADPNPGYMPTSIEDLNPENHNVYVYPNPVQDILYITAGATVKQVEVYNLQGQLIKKENANVNEISTIDLSSGLYLLRVTSDKGVSTHKFIKQ